MASAVDLLVLLLGFLILYNFVDVTFFFEEGFLEYFLLL